MKKVNKFSYPAFNPPVTITLKNGDIIYSKFFHCIL